ncbi:MAG: PspC domain-containing protein [Lachnospiraceae bacterium]|nr:PspC domain-containing protein [Lachnospiraceae bacterium]MBQ9563141.1 PspC domain-containing protein [Lachnospiraceae bacterium]MBQ9593795.1 PspC domain-containing protein [Lachnospiraceae bacterium]MBR0152169.1 PspC domain-containing protein [Lachnospiraceae bacterium]
MNNGKRLTRSKKNKVVAGVCGGLAEYLNVDPTIIRLAAALFCVMGGSGILLYVIAAIIMPEDSGDDYYYES